MAIIQEVSHVQISSMQSIRNGFPNPKEVAKRKRILCWFLTNWWITKNSFSNIGQWPSFMMIAALLVIICDFFWISFGSAKRLCEDPRPLEKPCLFFHVKRFGITCRLLHIASCLISPYDGIINLDILMMSNWTKIFDFGSWKKFHCKGNATNRIFVFLKDVGSWLVCLGKGRRHFAHNVWDFTFKRREGTL
jgi:hypothetical protein